MTSQHPKKKAEKKTCLHCDNEQIVGAINSGKIMDTCCFHHQGRDKNALIAWY